MNETLLLMTLFIAKHFIFDFGYQPPYQWMNKGTYGHPGGLFHAGQHAIASVWILAGFVSFPLALILAFLEFVIHYHVDWAKMAFNKKMGWGANTHSQFWVLLGFDQFLHYLTYVGMVAIALHK